MQICHPQDVPAPSPLLSVAPHLQLPFWWSGFPPPNLSTDLCRSTATLSSQRHPETACDASHQRIQPHGRQGRPVEVVPSKVSSLVPIRSCSRRLPATS